MRNKCLLMCLFILLFIPDFAYSQFDGFPGDLRVVCDAPSGTFTVTMEIVSVPFEGIIQNRKPIHDYNRIGEMYNGTVHRLYLNSGSGQNNYPIFYKNVTVTLPNGGNILSIAHCSGGELPEESCIHGAWGFAKYKFTITRTVGSSNETYTFYLNCLDSKYGKLYFGERNIYADDWTFKYLNNRPVNNKLILTGFDNNGYAKTYAEFNTSTEPELKVWELLYNNPVPFEKNFQARTTPFPIHPQLLADNYNSFKELELGTTVIFGNVYNNVGGHDIYGYNTVTNYLYDFYGSPPIPSNDPGYTFCTPGFFDPPNNNYGMTIKVTNGDKIIINENIKLWVTGYDAAQKGDLLKFESSSNLEMHASAQINTCYYGRLVDYGANTVWGNYSRHTAYANSTLEYYGNEHIVNNKGSIVVKSDGKLKLGDNTTLIFDGEQTYLWLDPNSQVILGNNAQIKFRNGAYLIANGATFDNLNGYWQGIVFENAGSGTVIQNCTFNKAIVALNYYNSSAANFNTPIKNNVFNVQNPNPNDRYKAIYARNVYNLTFEQNTFNLASGSIGVLIQNSFNPPEPRGEEGASELKFINQNVFNGGYLQLLIAGYASVNIPVYIYNNTFTNGGWCFAGRMISGTVKQNTFTRSAYNYTFGLWQSNPSLLNNTIVNQNGGTVFLSAAYPLLAPTVNTQNKFEWYGGNNTLNASNGDAMAILAGKPVLDWGKNSFTISNTSFYHLYGIIDGSETQYYARDNCWYGFGGIPKYMLMNVYENPVSMIYQPIPTNCIMPINYTAQMIFELGDGVYDTVMVSDNTGTSAPADEVLYSQAQTYSQNGAYYDAIINLKNIIDNYPASEYLYTSLYDLYTCYEGLDTSDQNHRDIIFGDLKFYLENKIVQYPENDEFVSIAYNLILMCESMIENYNEAMTGYEFISLYHPDPEQRLLASMDYGEIQTYLNGMGGGESSNPKKTTVNILKLMDKKPYTRIVKEIYTKASRELETKLNDKNLREDISLIKKKELVERAKENINVSRGLTREQREERIMDDIKLLIGEDYGNTQNNNVTVPARYTLHQNYPNPFNPTTTIKYELPNDGIITFRIYDILGKEIYSINEFKKAGIYSITFDGSKYASGIYFYRLESGSYTETKKMVLVK